MLRGAEGTKKEADWIKRERRIHLSLKSLAVSFGEGGGDSVVTAAEHVRHPAVIDHGASRALPRRLVS
jgi:hypothetical protein